MKLFLIQANDDNGENQDWFVRAETPQQAMELYCKHHYEEPSAGEWIVAVFQIPTDPGPEGVLEWESMRCTL